MGLIFRKYFIMKKIILFNTWLILCGGLPVMCQKTIIKDKSHSFIIAYGYKPDATWWKNVYRDINFPFQRTINNGYFKYQYGISKKMSLGLEAVFFEDNQIKHTEPFSIIWSEDYSYAASASRFSVFCNYYFLSLGRLNFYVNAATGFYKSRARIIHSYPDPNPLNSLGIPGSTGISEVVYRENKTGVDFSAGAGMSYFIGKHTGFFLETGYNKSVIQIGLIVKSKRDSK